jgi:hypothetical protein
MTNLAPLWAWNTILTGGSVFLLGINPINKYVQQGVQH